MSLDSMTEQGDAMVEMMNRSMMENSVNPDLGGNIDIMIWQTKVVSGGFDLFFEMRYTSNLEL